MSGTPAALAAAARRVHSGGPWEERFGYCRAVARGPLVAVSGSTATVGGAVTQVGDAHGQARTAFGIALAALAELGLGAEHVLRTRMYLTDIDRDSDAVGRAHAEFFAANPPAASMVQVARLIHPDHLVEVELDAWNPEAP
ncbi:Rid family hydrolase [Allonocardiopsis opalescens]|uniref:Enamine deaminase RidA (YjgF/YER057c/UK114 family) n=1 Tax=Allonocardiopsis opalescens TaxID=1144618 RepID=A0A2T0Q3Z0_9ACTN|nr:Rid family hydrolase [Allonocardiopsis opalescens]PRX98518.1 enamine deaminase RidA (YjgF/YER057c/UK114 family) [Allonocardiopsis opalescens]